jgi:hypothetical protein
MAKSLLIDPGGVRERLRKVYRSRRRRWIEGTGVWPLSIPLGVPTERQARDHLAEVKAWQESWHAWRGEGEIVWSERRWSGLGTQKLPEKVLLNAPMQVAVWIGEVERWQRATERYALMTENWPRLVGTLSSYYDVLSDYSEDDYKRLFDMLRWLVAHPHSGMYIRQLPVAGVDTKWLSARKTLIAGLLRAIRSEYSDDNNFFGLTGIRQEPVLIRLRLLDAGISPAVGGLQDITAPVEEIACLQLPLHRVYIVENMQTGLAFGKLPEGAVFMGLGYAVDLFDKIPWIRQLPCYYWGDLDTHGFAILNRLRHYLPHAKSLLMDQATLLDHQIFWGQEDAPVLDAELPLLTNDEQSLYRDLCSNRWGTYLRLEQERIPWEYAWKRLCDVSNSDGSAFA